MKTFVIALNIILLAALTGCYKDYVPRDTPNAIIQKINEIKAEAVRNPPASVWQYEYNGKTVYYFPPYCCDIPSLLFDGEGNLICSPDGGFSGTGDGRCTDFVSKRKNEKLIWQDSRKYPAK